MVKVELESIINIAENFECCPYCGDTNENAIHRHLCDKCHERVAVPENAYWFAEHLKQLNHKLEG